MEQRGKTILHPSAPGGASFGQGNREKVWCEEQFSVCLGEAVYGRGSKSLSEVERLRLTVAKQEVEIARLKKGYWVEGVGAKKEYVTGKEKTMRSSKNCGQSTRSIFCAGSWA